MRPQREMLELDASGASGRVAQLQYDRLRLAASPCHMTSTRLWRLLLPTVITGYSDTGTDVKWN